jgi:pyruvate dehydrogenase complex dehydrogenase (E1) component
VNGNRLCIWGQAQANLRGRKAMPQAQCIASTDHMKLFAEQIRQWYRAKNSNGTTAVSDSRKRLRHFEVTKIGLSWQHLSSLPNGVCSNQGGG